MTDICKTVKDILYARNIANFPGQTTIGGNTWIMELSKLPVTPDTAIGIVQPGGKAPNPKWAIDYPSIQVIIRGTANGGVAAKQKAMDVKDVLLGFDSASLNGDRITAINMIGDIATMGYDSQNRPMYSVNFTLIVEPAISGLSNRQAL